MSIPITEYRNAKVLTADGSRLDVEINHPEAGWIPYTLDVADTDMTIDNSALLTLIGDDKEAYVAPTPEEAAATLSAEVRADRDFRLSQLDIVLSNPLRWAAMSDEEKAPWITYRQALLDVPQQSGFPNSVTWPSSPDGMF
tara:strand:+ start:1390 stop:1812 length:423 start_codon:yes stop_codon:yes gene_type:complete